jgi:hypothetical protein
MEGRTSVASITEVSQPELKGPSHGSGPLAKIHGQIREVVGQMAFCILLISSRSMLTI